MPSCYYRCRMLLVCGSIAVCFVANVTASQARADVFQWEYIDPAKPYQGKQRSSTLCDDGASVRAGAGVDLSHMNLAKAYLPNADFTAANLVEADFSDALLRSARFAGANLTGAKIRGAALRRCEREDSLPR